ncbi:MAG: T9SS type A sorting domain-containing protein [Bacteroidetes bacterium]|nr:T9SS type A sorting domain-containing protein [Bacteroidota bacterium]
MKLNYIITIILLIITSNAFGQNFGVVGTEWYYSEHGLGGAPYNSEYLHLESITDTVIQGQSSHKIIQTYYKYNGDIVTLKSIYLFEQSDTVFLYSFQRSKFLILYILNGNPGDTLTLDVPYDFIFPDSTYRLVIDTVININIDGIPLKKYGTTALDYYQFYNVGGYFMDRIGGQDWFFPRQGIFPEAGGPIRCYSDLQIDTSFQAVACDFRLISSVNEVGQEVNTVLVYPNPVKNELNISLKNNGGACIIVYNLLGKSVKEVTFNQEIITIDLSDLLSGLYLYRINDSRGRLIDNGKLIAQ